MIHFNKLNIGIFFNSLAMLDTKAILALFKKYILHRIIIALIWIKHCVFNSGSIPSILACDAGISPLVCRSGACTISVPLITSDMT